jgi:hypothetical protein
VSREFGILCILSGIAVTYVRGVYVCL